MNHEQSLSKIASILSNGKSPQNQITEIGDVVAEAGEEQGNPVNDIWKDPMVQEALKDGRAAEDICVIRCPECHRYNYYNEGSHYSCRFGCGTWTFHTDDTFLEENEPVTLVDTVTEVTDGYHNRTL